jgi:hypothetical protein
MNVMPIIVRHWPAPVCIPPAASRAIDARGFDHVVPIVEDEVQRRAHTVLIIDDQDSWTLRHSFATHRAARFSTRPTLVAKIVRSLTAVCDVLVARALRPLWRP